jgi:hypothetical protein
MDAVRRPWNAMPAVRPLGNLKDIRITAVPTRAITASKAYIQKMT